MQDPKWIRCPRCGGKTRVKMLPTTIMRDFPLYCHHCKKETIVNVANFKVFPKKNDKES